MPTLTHTTRCIATGFYLNKRSGVRSIAVSIDGHAEAVERERGVGSLICLVGNVYAVVKQKTCSSLWTTYGEGGMLSANGYTQVPDSR